MERLVGQLSENGTVAIAYTSSHLVDAHNIFIKKVRGKGSFKYSGHEFIVQKMAYGNSIINASSAIFSRKALKQISQDYTAYKASGDYLFWIYLAEQGDVVYVRDAHNYFRQHNLKVSPGAVKSGLVFFETIKIFRYLKLHNYLKGLREHLAHGYYMWLITKVNFDNKGKKKEIIDMWKKECSCSYLNKYIFICMHSFEKLKEAIRFMF